MAVAGGDGSVRRSLCRFRYVVCQIRLKGSSVMCHRPLLSFVFRTTNVHHAQTHRCQDVPVPFVSDTKVAGERTMVGYSTNLAPPHMPCLLSSSLSQASEQMTLRTHSQRPLEPGLSRSSKCGEGCSNCDEHTGFFPLRKVAHEHLQ